MARVRRHHGHGPPGVQLPVDLRRPRRGLAGVPATDEVDAMRNWPRTQKENAAQWALAGLVVLLLYGGVSLVVVLVR